MRTKNWQYNLSLKQIEYFSHFCVILKLNRYWAHLVIYIDSIIVTL